MLSFPDEKSVEAFNWAPIDSELKQRNEKYVYQAQLYDKASDESCLIVLSDKAFYQHDKDTNTLRRRRDYVSLHSVQEDLVNKSCFFVYSYKHMAQQMAIQTLGNLGIGSPLDFSLILQRRHFSCESEAQCVSLVMLFQKLMRDGYQQVVEKLVVPAPEIYQFHTNSIKVNRKLKAQDRMLVLSNSWIYNLEPSRDDNGISSFDKKWAFPIHTIKVLRLTHSKEKIDLGPAFTLYFDVEACTKILKTDKAHIGSKGSDINDSHTFAFQTEEERSVFVAELCRLFFLETNKGLKPGDNPRQLNVDTEEDMTVAALSQRRSILRTSVGSPAEANLRVVSAKGNASNAIVLSGNMFKFTHQGKSGHLKYFQIYASGLVDWRDTPQDTKKLEARILSVNSDVSELKNKKDLSEDERNEIFTIQTTGKTLMIRAKDPAERKNWVKSIETILANRK